MSKTTVFLSGACKNVDVAKRNKWRQDIDNLNLRDDWPFVIFNPNKKFSYESNDPMDEKLVMDYFLYKLEHSDVIVVNLGDSALSVGTGMEIMHAVDNRKFIIGFNDTNSYGYIKKCCNVVVETVDDVWDFLMGYFV